MSLRDGINQKPAVGVVLVVIMLAVAVTIMVRRGGSSPRVPQARYLYDLDAGALVVGDVSQLQSTSSSRVAARVYSCSSCVDETKRFIAMLEKPNPSADLEAGESPILIRAADGEQWVSPNSDAGMQIAMKANEKCGGMPRSECYPE